MRLFLLLPIAMIIGCGRQVPTSEPIPISEPPGETPIRTIPPQGVGGNGGSAPMPEPKPGINQVAPMFAEDQRTALLSMKPGTVRREVERMITSYRSSNPSAQDSFEPTISLPRGGSVTIFYPLDHQYAQVVYQTLGDDGVTLKDEMFAMRSISLTSTATP